MEVMEKENTTIVDISIDLLDPHPNNPRTHFGDLQELADSIKAKGILQNLTVIPNSGRYWVLIGNRRLAAGKLAGRKTLPCRIVEMDLKDQITTMLLENIQRNDLTVIEQADGFQMALNLGLGMDELSQQTGFSKKTIRHRMKLLELDKDAFNKKAEQMTLTDFILLEGIKNLKTRNEILKQYGGTPQLKIAIEKAKRLEQREENKKHYLQQLRQLGIKKSPKISGILI